MKSALVVRLNKAGPDVAVALFEIEVTGLANGAVEFLGILRSRPIALVERPLCAISGLRI